MLVTAAPGAMAVGGDLLRPTRLHLMIAIATITFVERLYTWRRTEREKAKAVLGIGRTDVATQFGLATTEVQDLVARIPAQCWRAAAARQVSG